MPIDSFFVVVLGLDRSSTSYTISKVKQSVEIFAMKISDSEKEKPSKLDTFGVVDLPKSFYTAVLGSSFYICDSSNARTVQVLDIDLYAKTVKSRGSGYDRERPMHFVYCVLLSISALLDSQQKKVDEPSMDEQRVIVAMDQPGTSGPIYLQDIGVDVNLQGGRREETALKEILDMLY
nr:hypothetical protein CFP56_65677 [Quercus suber]